MLAPAPTIDELTLADDPARWAALGFALAGDACQIGAVRLRFVGPAGATQQAGSDQPGSERPGSERPGSERPGSEQPGSGPPGIVGWSLRDAASADLDGLPTTLSHSPIPEPAAAHPNGVLAIDHVVAASPQLDRSVAALQAAGLDLRRVREQPTPAGAPRQAFFRLGGEILELIQEPEQVIARAGGRDHPARFWGLALLVEDLDRTVQVLAPHAGEARAAVQPGRRIATVRRSAGLVVPLALMSRDERAEERG